MKKSQPRPHGAASLRGIEHVPCSVHHEPGRFGRLFPALPGLSLETSTLETLAKSMREEDTPSGDSSTPAGFTFLGQFIDHDITLDTTSSLDRQSDPAAVRNMRIPTLGLDSMYRGGLETDPMLFDRNRHGRFLTGTRDNPDDLARNDQETALIGDPRNDENGIISQLHLGFLRFHNGVMQLLEDGKVAGPRYFDDDFREAQRLVRWHYQWIVVNEFLPFIVDEAVLDSIFRDGPTIYRSTSPFIPVEFSVAAYRFGHSQVRNRYTVNGEVGELNLFQAPGLTSFGAVPAAHVVDWSYFFQSGDGKPQPSRKIDGKLAHALFELPFIPASDVPALPMRNLLRGQTFSLPSGEAVAHRMGIEPISPSKLGTGLDQNPLWFYCLKEAELNDEDRLGEVGGRIVAETLLGLLRSDPSSYLSQAPRWQPTLPGGHQRDAGPARAGRRGPRGRPPVPGGHRGSFGMADLLEIARRHGR